MIADRGPWLDRHLFIWTESGTAWDAAGGAQGSVRHPGPRTAQPSRTCNYLAISHAPGVPNFHFDVPPRSQSRRASPSHPKSIRINPTPTRSYLGAVAGHPYRHYQKVRMSKRALASSACEIPKIIFVVHPWRQAMFLQTGAKASKGVRRHTAKGDQHGRRSAEPPTPSHRPDNSEPLRPGCLRPGRRGSELSG